MNLVIRISREYDVIKPWFETFTADKCIVYEHPKDDKVSRTHCHVLVYNASVKPDNMKYHLKKIDSTLKGRTDWVFSEKEVNDKFITYMSKGIHNPKMYKGYTEDEINKYKSEWVNPVSLKVDNGKLVIDKPVKETKKKTKRELIELMKARYTEDMDTHEICKLIRKVLIENNEVIGLYKFTDYYDALLMYGNKERFLDMVVTKINSRIRV